MLQLLLATMLTCSAPHETPPQDPQRVKAAVAELEKAFKEGRSAERIKAIHDGEPVVDAQVIRWIAHGLQDHDAEVERAAIEALRFIDHPDALKELQSSAQRDESLRKDPELYAALLKAIGQHASPSSIPLLKEGLWSVQDRSVIQARILGLGQIRTEAAAEALIGLMRTGGRAVIQPFMEDFRLALAVLTGVDQGRSQDLWTTWWNENRAKLKIDPRPPTIAKPLQRAWDSYWRASDRAAEKSKHPDRKSDGSDKSGGKP